MKFFNHLIFLIDESGSMQYHRQNVIKVFQNLFNTFANSNDPNNETFVSLYKISDHVGASPVISDASIKHLKGTEVDNYRPGGQTPLLDVMERAIQDGVALQERFNNTRVDEDHAFLVYVITDGEENSSRRATHASLSKLVGKLDDRWTVAAMVPNATAVHHAKRLGIPAGNIEIWNVNSARGFEEAGARVQASYSNYMTMRSSGQTNTKALFSVDVASLSVNVVEGNLTQIGGRIYDVPREMAIRPFAEAVLGHYPIGKVYYELTKREELQPQKQIVIVNVLDGRRYGGQEARAVLGLPAGRFDIKPGNTGDWKVYVQSTSVNRKLPAGTSAFVAD